MTMLPQLVSGDRNQPFHFLRLLVTHALDLERQVLKIFNEERNDPNYKEAVLLDDNETARRSICGLEGLMGLARETTLNIDDQEESDNMLLENHEVRIAAMEELLVLIEQRDRAGVLAFLQQEVASRKEESEGLVLMRGMLDKKFGRAPDEALNAKQALFRSCEVELLQLLIKLLEASA